MESKVGRWSLRRAPVHVDIQRVHGSRHALPLHLRQVWRGQAGHIDFNDALVGKEFIKSGAEVAARLDDDAARGGQIHAHHFKEDRVFALLTNRDHNHLHAAHLQQRGGAQQDGLSCGHASAPGMISCKLLII